MRILIDIGHPAHVHLFKHFAWGMQKKGHEVFFTCREKEFEIDLLRQYGFQFKSFGKKYKSRSGKLVGLLEFDMKEFLSGLHFKPDIFLSHGSIYATHAAFLLHKTNISLEDTGNWEQVRLYLPFTSCVLTSDIFPIDYGKKQIRFKSHNELAYLHPNYFTPDPSFKEKIGLKPDEEYIIMRFVAWNATHDIGQKGLSDLAKIEIAKKLSQRYKILISSEYPLPYELEKYKISFKPHQIHDALYQASLFIGEGTTMAMEAAILGTPSIYINSLQYSNVKDMASYDLLFNFSQVNNAVVEKILSIALEKDLKNKTQAKRQRMLGDKIDLTSFLIWFIDNYPESFQIMKTTPDYQLKFK